MDGCYTMPPMSEYGWYWEEGALKVRWETEENMAKVAENIAHLLKGCKCKTGCTTGE